MATSQAEFWQSADEIDHLIRLAIREKAPLRVIYNGGVRLVCPQMLGRNRDGRVRILCLQTVGESASGLRRGDEGDWRCLALEKFQSVERADALWRSSGDSLRRPKCIDKIEVEVVTEPVNRDEHSSKGNAGGGLSAGGPTRCVTSRLSMGCDARL